MRKKNDSSYGQSNSRFESPTPKYEYDKSGVTQKVEEALGHVAPVFCVRCPEATNAMIASVMRMTKLYADANNDDVAKVLIALALPFEVTNGKMYFDLAQFRSKRSRVAPKMEREQ